MRTRSRAPHTLLRRILHLGRSRWARTVPSGTSVLQFFTMSIFLAAKIEIIRIEPLRYLVKELIDDYGAREGRVSTAVEEN